MKLNFKNKLSAIFTGLFTISLLGGCATISGGSAQRIEVKVVDAKNQELIDRVSCVISDDKGDRYQIKDGNPGNVLVQRNSRDLTIVCKKPGYRQLNTSIGKDFDKKSLWNVLFWPGAVVDGATGAYKKYPSHYVVSMEKIRNYFD